MVETMQVYRKFTGVIRTVFNHIPQSLPNSVIITAVKHFSGKKRLTQLRVSRIICAAVSELAFKLKVNRLTL